MIIIIICDVLLHDVGISSGEEPAEDVSVVAVAVQ